MTYKQTILVRTDLKMGKGKIAAQVAHAAIGSIRKGDRHIIDEWEREGSKKVVLKVDGIKQLIDISKEAKLKNISYYIVRDAGLTQIEEGTVTCMALGPEKEYKLDRLTEKLKLL